MLAALKITAKKKRKNTVKYNNVSVHILINSVEETVTKPDF